jgi:hypothetical protein
LPDREKFHKRFFHGFFKTLAARLSSPPGADFGAVLVNDIMTDTLSGNSARDSFQSELLTSGDSTNAMTDTVESVVTLDFIETP